MTPKQKDTFTRYKDYRNLSSTLLKRSKRNYYNHYFDIIGTTLKILRKA